jgi:hypothetical protein
MPNRFPNSIQAAVLFEKKGGFFSRGKALQIEDLAKQYFDIQAAKSGHRYNIIEHVRGEVLQFYGGNQLMIRLEFMNKQANKAVFAGTLASAFTRMALPEAEQLIDAHATHLLITVRHGVLPDLPTELMAIVNEAGIKEGYSLEQFRERLDVCALLCNLAHDMAEASVVHWTQSNMLLKPNLIEVGGQIPSIMHIHPRLFQDGETNGQPNVGIVTHGAQHFVGREIEVRPNPIPWPENFQAALMFLAMAVTKNGYVIPDGDNFGVEGGDFSYKVKHVEPSHSGEAAIPGSYQLDLRYSEKHKYRSPLHPKDGDVIDIDNPPLDLINPANPLDQEMMEEFQEKRARAERVGGQFRVTGPVRTPNAPRTFGKRTLN